MDNPFDTPLSGQADWDSGLGANFQALERGYHVTERAGQAVSSGQVLWLNSGGFFFPYNPNSAATQPHAYAFTAAASGDSLTALAWGIVRSFDINSPLFPGQLAFCNESGFLSAATLGLAVGYGLSGRGVLFNPAKVSGGGGGVTMIQSLSDVNPAGLANDSILKWSNTSSKFVMAVDSTGGGGVTVPQYPFAPPDISSFSFQIGSPVAITSHAYGTVLDVGSLFTGDKIDGWAIAAGTAPWTYVLGVKALATEANFSSFGMCVTDGTKLQTFWFQYNTGWIISMARYSNRTTFDTNLLSMNFKRDMVKYLRIQNDGTNYIFGVSQDGEHFWDALTYTNSYLNTASPHYIGIIGDRGAGSGYMYITAEYFAKTA